MDAVPIQDIPRGDQESTLQKSLLRQAIETSLADVAAQPGQQRWGIESSTGEVVVFTLNLNAFQQLCSSMDIAQDQIRLEFGYLPVQPEKLRLVVRTSLGGRAGFLFFSKRKLFVLGTWFGSKREILLSPRNIWERVHLYAFWEMDEACRQELAHTLCHELWHGADYLRRHWTARSSKFRRVVAWLGNAAKHFWRAEPIGAFAFVLGFLSLGMCTRVILGSWALIGCMGCIGAAILTSQLGNWILGQIQEFRADMHADQILAKHSKLIAECITMERRKVI